MDERIKQKNIPPALYHIEQEGLKLHLSYKPYFNLKTLRPAVMAALFAGVDLRVQ